MATTWRNSKSHYSGISTPTKALLYPYHRSVRQNTLRKQWYTAVMSSRSQSVTNLVGQLSSQLDHITFKDGTSFYWSPENKTISYISSQLDDHGGVWSLLHEVGHARLEHKTYSSDFELLSLEVAAWQNAQLLANELAIAIEEDHIQECLDTYRDWLHRRSTCPTCGTVGLQHSPIEYRCHNCTTTWKVSASRFCRPYRTKNTTSSNDPSAGTKKRSVFH